MRRGRDQRLDLLAQARPHPIAGPALPAIQFSHARLDLGQTLAPLGRELRQLRHRRVQALQRRTRLAQVLGGGGASGGGLGGLGKMLDMDGDGNPLDDIIGMAGKLAR